MMHIKYKLKVSKLHGVGLFADQAIQKGDLLYTASHALDVNLTQDQFDALSDQEKKEIMYWGFFDESSQKWHVDFDVSKFINHSTEPTVTQDPNHTEAYLIATRDIKADEELTQGYREFESAEEFMKRGIV